MRLNSKKLAEHHNMIFFSAPSISTKSFSEIEELILRKWKDNSILHFIRNKWYSHVQKHLEKFGTNAPSVLQDTLMETFKHLIGHLTYIVYRNYFSVLEKDQNKGKQWIIEKLCGSTAIYAITQGNSWKKVYDHVILPTLLVVKQPSFVSK